MGLFERLAVVLTSTAALGFIAVIVFLLESRKTANTRSRPTSSGTMSM
jgi:hypothetical protein